MPAGLVESLGVSLANAEYSDPAVQVDLSTDDWPFFYMTKRKYPVSYIAVLSLMLILSFGLTKAMFQAELRFSQAVFFLLGAGFMLVETKGITELGLTFGNTWHVIGIVIAGILSMAFIANVVVQRLGIDNLILPYLLLMATLCAGLRFLDVFSGTGTISFTEKTQPEYLFRTLLPQCVSIMARLP